MIINKKATLKQLQHNQYYCDQKQIIKIKIKIIITMKQQQQQQQPIHRNTADESIDTNKSASHPNRFLGTQILVSKKDPMPLPLNPLSSCGCC